MEITGRNVEAEINSLFDAISDLRLTIARVEDGIYQPQPCENGCSVEPACIVLSQKISKATQEVLMLNSRMCLVDKTISSQLQGLRLE